MNIFELQKQWLSVLELTDQLDEDTLNDTLESIEEPMQEKLENMYKVTRHIENDVDMIDKELKRLQEIKKSKNKSKERLKEMIYETVKLIGEQTKSGGRKVTFNSPYIKSIYTQKNPPSVKVTDPDFIPKQYWVPQPPKIDAKAIADAWKKDPDNIIAGVEITQGEGVRFK